MQVLEMHLPPLSCLTRGTNSTIVRKPCWQILQLSWMWTAQGHHRALNFVLLQSQLSVQQAFNCTSIYDKIVAIVCSWMPFIWAMFIQLHWRFEGHVTAVSSAWKGVVGLPEQNFHGATKTKNSTRPRTTIMLARALDSYETICQPGQPYREKHSVGGAGIDFPRNVVSVWS